MTLCDHHRHPTQGLDLLIHSDSRISRNGDISNLLRYGYHLCDWMVNNDSVNGSCAVIFLDIVIGGELLDYYLRRDGAVLASTHLKLWPRSKNNVRRYGHMHIRAPLPAEPTDAQSN
jgi:hypothetical protein